MRTIMILYCLFCCAPTFAQDASFIVMDVSGTVTTGQNKKLLMGTGVAANETVTVGQGSKVTLACKNSGYARFSAPGKYKLNTADYCKMVNDPAFARLCKFAWHQFSGHESEHDWREHLDNVGAASRGTPCAATVDNNLGDIYYCDGDFALSWLAPKPAAPLFINVYKSENSAPFLQLPVSSNKYLLAQLLKQVPETRDYYWNIATKNDRCAAMYHIHFISAQYRDSVVTSITNSINNDITDNAARQYWAAILLENKHFFADAYAHYTQAARLAPADKRYSNELKAFKKKYNTP